MTAVLRQAGRADVPGIQRVRHSVRENRLTSCRISDAEVVEAIEVSGRGWVIESDGEVVGFAIGNAQNGNIWALFIDPAHERRGYGRRLHDTMLAWLAAHGPERLWLSTETGTRAEGFYRRAGWIDCGLLASGERRFERIGRSDQARPAHDGSACGEETR
jgi:GNAT superfamily N-acetyltransferase